MEPSITIAINGTKMIYNMVSTYNYVNNIREGLKKVYETNTKVFVDRAIRQLDGFNKEKNEIKKIMFLNNAKEDILSAIQILTKYLENDFYPLWGVWERTSKFQPDFSSAWEHRERYSAIVEITNCYNLLFSVLVLLQDNEALNIYSNMDIDLCSTEIDKFSIKFVDEGWYSNRFEDDMGEENMGRAFLDAILILPVIIPKHNKYSYDEKKEIMEKARKLKSSFRSDILSYIEQKRMVFKEKILIC